ncbi:MAG: hypothetical protein AB1485_03515, partial [Candidatus Thermoplasmatota archaeon]
LCTIILPKSLIPANATLKVFIDNESVIYLLTENSTCYFINFTCQFSRRYVIITWTLPEILPPEEILPPRINIIIIIITAISILIVVLVILSWVFIIKKKKLKK